MLRLHTALLLAVLLAFNAGAAMHPMQIQKIERFKRNIDFDGALRQENTTQAVRVMWPHPLNAPGVGASWTVADDTTWRANGGTAREWVLRRGAETLGVLIFVSRGGVDAARQFLLHRASENMMVDVPYVKAPFALGTLAVQSPAPQAPALIWVYRTVCFHVYGESSTVDIEPIAKWLQAAAESGLVAASGAQIRAPGPLHVSTNRAAVGQPIDIAVAAPAADEARYLIDLEFDSKAVDMSSQRRLTAQLRGKAPGRSTVDLYLIDRSTLLSGHTRIGLEFVPKP
jgi:hypothetical protein